MNLTEKEIDFIMKTGPFEKGDDKMDRLQTPLSQI
jgi:hypothetical protein